jgi:NAD(P)-dependent dehydrogenase (short-subunit alcohol dehydrogenase family)
VAIVTGGGNGLGKSHCLLLASLGAKVVVNDVGGSVNGEGTSESTAMSVVEEIKSNGGEAIASAADITQPNQVNEMVEQALDAWGRIDVLINNAGILRDKSFANMTIEDFMKVLDVHLYGTVNCSLAVWDIMRQQQYGRILLTTSSSGLYGNFGQANYGAAKAAMLGLMNVLHLEGVKYGIHVNMLAPSAATRMLEGLVSNELSSLLDPSLVSPGAVYLVSDKSPSKICMDAGAGCFSTIRTLETKGTFLGKNASVDDIAKNWSEIANTKGEHEFHEGIAQTQNFVQTAANALNITI